MQGGILEADEDDDTAEIESVPERSLARSSPAFNSEQEGSARYRVWQPLIPVTEISGKDEEDPSAAHNASTVWNTSPTSTGRAANLRKALIAQVRSCAFLEANTIPRRAEKGRSHSSKNLWSKCPRDPKVFCPQKCEL